MYILGINGGVRLGYQDISAVLLEDGRIVAAVEEERLNRIKHSPGQLPELSIKYVLKEAGISIHDIDFIASHGSTWGEQYEEVLKGYFKYNFGHVPKIQRVHHHDAHSASAFYASGFEEALVISIDNSGDGASTQISIGRNGKMELLDRFSRPDSLGIFYSLITQHCGFRRDTDEYKLMGLSSYGDRDKYDLGWLLTYGDGKYSLDEKYLKSIPAGAPQPTRQEMIFSNLLIDKLGPKRFHGQPFEQHHKDLAASAQRHLEDVLVHLVTHYHQQTGLSKICLAGGVALNCVANQKLMNLDFIDDIYVQPASSDAGISMGAAYIVSAGEGVLPKPMESVYLGPKFSNDQIREALNLLQINYSETDNPAGSAAQFVADDKVVGWFQNRMEMGPRALGARSILANPANPDMRDIVNAKVKFRESYRPFCPSVLEEDSSEYFLGKQKVAPYMTVTYDVDPGKADKIPSVTHVDNTARIQTVNEKQNPLYFDYLKGLKKLTGIGISMNTSFNRNLEPIVSSPYDAIACFYGCGMDKLVIGNFVVEK